MADISDVSNAIVSLIGAAVYPSGSSSASAVGVPCKIYPGWPLAKVLDLDVQGKIEGASGGVVSNGVGPIAHISVYPQPNMERVTTRYPREWAPQQSASPSISASVSGAVVTLSGAFTAGDYATIIVDGSPYSVMSASTLAATASALASAVSPSAAATASGATITFPANLSGMIVARTGRPSTLIREIRRQQHSFQITIWAPTNAARAGIANLIDPIVAATDFLALPDGSQAWLVYRGQNDSDSSEVNSTYRRDLFYWVEYATTQTMTGYQVTAFAPTLAPQGPSTSNVSSP